MKIHLFHAQCPMTPVAYCATGAGATMPNAPCPIYKSVKIIIQKKNNLIDYSHS
ncbi:MAG: hypothetical protein ACHBN1_22180 [Heteroscytonema crispum UTEX LB 1556]